MDNLQDDIILDVLKNLEPSELQKTCASNKKMHDLCSRNKEYIQKFFIKKYIPDYKDKTNFIYTVGNAIYGDSRSIFKTYMKYYYKTHKIYKYNDNIVSDIPKNDRF